MNGYRLFACWNVIKMLFLFQFPQPTGGISPLFSFVTFDILSASVRSIFKENPFIIQFVDCILHDPLGFLTFLDFAKNNIRNGGIPS